jgi:hypothetical protein
MKTNKKTLANNGAKTNSDSGIKDNVSEVYIPLPNRPGYKLSKSEIIKEDRTGAIVQRFSPVPEVLHAEYCADAESGAVHTYTIKIGDIEKTFTYSELTESNWPDNFPELHGISDRKTRELYVDVIKFLAQQGANKTHTREKTGFHKIPCQEGELHGFLTPIYFLTGREEWPYQLRLKGSNAEQYLDDIALESFRRDTRTKAGRKIVAADAEKVFTTFDAIAPLGHLLICFINNLCALTNYLRPRHERAGHIIYLYGAPGCGKTSVASALRSVAMPYDFKSVDASFRDTPYSIEQALDARPFLPFVLDDLRKEVGETSAALASKYLALERITLAADNHKSVRERRKRNGERQKANYIDTLPIVTAEYAPTLAQDSLFRRMLMMKLEPGQVPINSTQERPGLTSLEALTPHMRGLYWLVAEHVINESNNGRAHVWTKSIKECAERHRNSLLMSLSAALPENGITDVRFNLCAIGGELVAAARVLDLLCNSKDLFTHHTELAVYNFIKEQLSWINERHGRAHGTRLIDDVLIRFVEELNDGRLHEGSYITFATLPSPNEPGKYAERERRFGYRTERGRMVDVGWLDKHKDFLIAGNLMQKQLARIASELDNKEYTTHDIYGLLNDARYIHNKKTPHGEKGIRYRARGCESVTLVRGWPLRASEFLRVIGEDEQGEE